MPAALFVSDLHLAAERPAISERFFAFLEDQAARAERLFILGDLFEYWIGDDELEDPAGDPLARAVADALKRVARRGVGVFLMHGNRDFLIGQRFAQAACACTQPGPSARRDTAQAAQRAGLCTEAGPRTAYL